MAVDDSTRAKALKLLTAGEITGAEAARLAGVSRQTVDYWCQQAEIDPVKARAARLQRLWGAKRQSAA